VTPLLLFSAIKIFASMFSRDVAELIEFKRAIMSVIIGNSGSIPDVRDNWRLIMQVVT
jgi:hypothetical protein